MKHRKKNLFYILNTTYDTFRNVAYRRQPGTLATVSIFIRLTPYTPYHLITPISIQPSNQPVCPSGNT